MHLHRLIKWRGEKWDEGVGFSLLLPLPLSIPLSLSLSVWAALAYQYRESIDYSSKGSSSLKHKKTLALIVRATSCQGIEIFRKQFFRMLCMHRNLRLFLICT
jgi:hypothetical protein